MKILKNFFAPLKTPNRQSVIHNNTNFNSPKANQETMEIMATEGSELDNELINLRSRLKQSLDKSTYWMNEELSQLQANQSRQHEEKLKELEEEKDKYKKLLSNKQEKDLLSNKELDEKCEKLKNLKTELERLCAVTQELHVVKAKEEQELKSVQQDIEKLEAEIAVPTEARQKLEYLNKASGLFTSMLGLTFRKVKGGKMQVIFSQIDEKDPLMTFHFILQIQGAGRKYVVSDSQPPVEGLEDLVAQLNSTNNIRQFMIAMRNKYKESLNKT